MEPHRYETSGDVRNEQGDIVGTYHEWVTDELVDDSPRRELWSKRHPRVFKLMWSFAITLNVVAWGAHLLR